MKTKFIVHPLKFIVCLATFAIGLVLAVCLILIKRYVSAAVFFGIGLMFLCIASVFGAVITVDDSGVSRSVLGRVRQSFRWDQVAEVGVAGAKVLKSASSQKTGELYIYFSPLALDDQQRFEMMLRWPPKDKIFMQYSRQRIEAVQMCWDSKLQLYNAGKLRLDSRFLE